MSHSVPVKTEFKSKSALKAAFAKLGWTMKENTRLRTYPRDPIGNKDFVLAAINPRYGGYDVGIVEKDGEIELVCDFYSPGRVTETLGSQFTDLKKKYVIAVTEEHYDQVVIEQQFADGSFILVADDGQ